MPNEVINTIHQLAAACNKHKGIHVVFTNKDSNIITDKNNDTEDNIEITGVEKTTACQKKKMKHTIAHQNKTIAHQMISIAQWKLLWKILTLLEWQKMKISNNKTSRDGKSQTRIRQCKQFQHGQGNEYCPNEHQPRNRQ